MLLNLVIVIVCFPIINVMGKLTLTHNQKYINRLVYYILVLMERKTTTNQVLEADTVKDFLSVYQHKKNTFYAYKAGLEQYFKFIEKHPDDYVVDIYDFEGQELKKLLRDYKNDVKQYHTYLKENFSPKTIRLKLTCIKTFLVHCEIELPKKFWNDLKRNGLGKSRITKYKIPSHDVLKNMLQHADVRGKALFLLISASGLRINEALSLRIQDIEFKCNGEPSIITIPAHVSKNKKPLTTYMHPEASDALKAWLRVRDDYIRRHNRRVNHLPTSRTGTFEDRTDTIFCISRETASFIFDRLREKSGYNQKDESGRALYTIHTLRKFFKANFPVKEIGDALLNHSESLKTVYPAYTSEEVQNIYKKNMHHLFVFERPAPESERIKQQQRQIDMLTKRLDEMAHQLGQTSRGAIDMPWTDESQQLYDETQADHRGL